MRIQSGHREALQAAHNYNISYPQEILTFVDSAKSTQSLFIHLSLMPPYSDSINFADELG